MEVATFGTWDEAQPMKPHWPGHLHFLCYNLKANSVLKMSRMHILKEKDAIQ